MKLKLITLTALGVFSLGSAVFANDPQDGQDRHGGRGGGYHHSSLDRTTEQLNLTPEQKAKVQPIVDQARPQIENIRREAMQKTKAVMDNTMARIRPMLTPEQQKKLDEAQSNRGGGRRGHRGQGGPDDPGDQ